jgi:large subunit ribosomal protein L10
MPLTKAKKAEKVTQLAHELEGSTSAIIGTFAKLTVAQDFELRKTVRAAGGRYRVLKNKLAARAAQGSKIGAALQGLKGVSSVAYTSGDPVALAKALSTWVGDNAEFTFKLGIIDGKVITVEEVKQLATMPGKEELFAKLLFLINSPAQRLATVINATGRDLAVVINQAVEKNKFAGAQAPAAAEQAPVAEQAQAAETPAAVAEPAAAAEPAASEVPVVEQAQVAETPAAVAEPAAAAAPEVSGGEAEAPAAE